MQFRRIRDLREDEELKQEEVAKLLQITQQQYSLYETGKREIPLSLCIILSRFYKVSLDYIAGLTNDKRGIGYSSNESKYNITQNGNKKAVVNIKNKYGD